MHTNSEPYINIYKSAYRGLTNMSRNAVGLDGGEQLVLDVVLIIV